MYALHKRKLFNDGNLHAKIIFKPIKIQFHAGDYFVVGMDIEQYDTADPEKYLKGLLASEQEEWVSDAYRSYLAVLPSPTIGFESFSDKVNYLKITHVLVIKY